MTSPSKKRKLEASHDQWTGPIVKTVTAEYPADQETMKAKLFAVDDVIFREDACAFRNKRGLSFMERLDALEKQSQHQEAEIKSLQQTCERQESEIESLQQTCKRQQADIESLQQTCKFFREELFTIRTAVFASVANQQTPHSERNIIAHGGRLTDIVLLQEK